MRIHGSLAQSITFHICVVHNHDNYLDAIQREAKKEKKIGIRNVSRLRYSYGNF